MKLNTDHLLRCLQTLKSSLSIFKELFRHGAKHGLLELEAVDRWFAYRDNRNTTAHDYGERIADAKRLQGRIAHVDT